jgi:hypothetical protein
MHVQLCVQKSNFESVTVNRTATERVPLYINYSATVVAATAATATVFVTAWQVRHFRVTATNNSTLHLQFS